jgi:hypothetical protein
MFILGVWKTQTYPFKEVLQNSVPSDPPTDPMLSLILTIKDSSHFPYAAIKAAVKSQ